MNRWISVFIILLVWPCFAFAEFNQAIADQAWKDKNYVLAFNQLSQSDPHSLTQQLKLAMLYFTGLGVTANKQKAMEIFSHFANQGNPVALYDLGLVYMLAENTEINHNEAIKLFTTAAQKKYAPAESALAMIYSGNAGELNGVTTDKQKAFDWATKAVADDNKLIEAHIALGMMYIEGIGVQADLKKAFDQLLIAAQAGSIYAQIQIGDFYVAGNVPGINKDIGKAKYWFKQAADQGNPYGQYQLASQIQDPATYYQLLTKSANQGFVPAQAMLCDNYMTGYFVAKDYNKALSLCELAAATGMPYAQVLLGYMCYAGHGTQIDLVKSYAWLSAALQTNTDKQLLPEERLSPGFQAHAKVLKDIIALKLTPEQLKQGDELAAKIMKTYPNDPTVITKWTMIKPLLRYQ